jgi:copper resistance protein C
MRSVRSRLLRGAVIMVAFLLIAPFSHAHAKPKIMVPAADSTVASPPTISVTFSEAVEPKFSSLSLTDEQGKGIGTANSSPLPSDPKTLTLSLPRLHPGGYLVHWVTVAVDGHRMEGEYKFTVK